MLSAIITFVIGLVVGFILAYWRERLIKYYEAGYDFGQGILDDILAFEIIYNENQTEIIGFKELDSYSLKQDYIMDEKGKIVKVWVQYETDPKLRRELSDTQIVNISYVKSSLGVIAQIETNNLHRQRIINALSKIRPDCLKDTKGIDNNPTEETNIIGGCFGIDAEAVINKSFEESTKKSYKKYINESFDSQAIHFLHPDAWAKLECKCYACHTENVPFMRLCPKCGNKRCPHIEDHRFKCTKSNEPNQIGELE